MQQEFSKTFQKCASYVRPKLLHRKNSLSTQYRRYNSPTWENYSPTEHVSTKNLKKGGFQECGQRNEKRIASVRSGFIECGVSGVRARKKESVRAFFRDSTFRIAGRENLAARRRDLLDACRAALRDLLPTLARFKSRSRAVFAKFITSHWDFSTAVDAAKSLL